jgi:hypothetical protein
VTARLFLGGPLDGQVREIPDDRLGAPIDVPVLDEDVVSLFRAGSDVPVREVATRRVTYDVARLALFGRILPVYADIRLDRHERDQRAAEWLLSPLAKGLLS